MGSNFNLEGGDFGSGCELVGFVRKKGRQGRIWGVCAGFATKMSPIFHKMNILS